MMDCKNNKCAYAVDSNGMTVCSRNLFHVPGKYELWQPDGAITAMLLPDGLVGIYLIDIKFCDMATKEQNEKSQEWFD